ncbi:MAG: bifunctional serine/threonine-protein kinase/formylglycine-generating enzyme family protein [Planctomycetota bacterium]
MTTAGSNRRVGPFVLRQALGAGGMGVVYRAVQEKPRREVALKVLRPGSLDVDQARRFQLESELLGRLQHPGIAQVLEAGTDGEGPSAQPYLAMELIDGQPLTAYAHDRRLGVRGRVRLLLDLAGAVQHAHGRGVVHRDLKPSNVLVDPDGRVKVIDFGVARALDGDAATALTRSNQVVGTLTYVAPEQVTGGEADARVDVYALGVLAYELLAGRPPLEVEGGPLPEAARRIRDETPPPLGSIAPGCRGDLEAIVAHALEKEPEHRYPSVGALAEDLERFLAFRPVSARPLSTLEQLRRMARRHRVVVGGALGTLLATLAAAVIATVLGARNAELAEAARLARDGSRRAADEANTERDAVEAETGTALRLSDGRVVRDLREAADRLWPTEPALLPELEAWLVAARPLVRRRPLHERRLAELRARGVREADASWSFASNDEQWQHDLLADLVSELEELESGLLSEAPDAVAPGHGWSIPRRLALACELGEASVDGARARRLWDDAIASIADPEDCPDYGGLRIVPQLGLLPLDRNPRTGLWEFVHLPSGAPPERGADGGWEITPATGVVLVLVPGGASLQGAQLHHPSLGNFDPDAPLREGPVHPVRVSPFFLSKYELNQAQWLRYTGENPSFFYPGAPALFGADESTAAPPGLLHPVERVSWSASREVLGRLGLALPTEAQWEYAARGGTTTPWWTGADKRSLADACNLADESARPQLGGTRAYESWDDGFPLTAPVDALRPNPFGLHHVLGNVWEWCHDSYDEDFYLESPELDPVCDEPDALLRMGRGGAFGFPARMVRTAMRMFQEQDTTSHDIGVRPARALEY